MPLFEISDEIRAIAVEGFSDLIIQIGKPCEIHYPPTWIVDADVVADPIGNKPASRWITGEAGTPDPTINTSGMRAVDTFDTINMLIAWVDKDFYIRPQYGVKINDGEIQSKFFMTDAPKIMKSEFMLLQTSLSSQFHLKYVRNGPIVDPSNITPGVFGICNWKKVV